jgi:hypothetical protein
MATCSIKIRWIDSVVPVGALNPTAIRVAVSLTNCPGGQVIVRTDHTGQSSATSVPSTGAVIELGVTKATDCDQDIFVEAWCASTAGPPNDLSCYDSQTLPLPCTQCARASVSYTAGQCVGNPPVQPITLQADISLPPGVSRQFRFDYDDKGHLGIPFTIPNTTPPKPVSTHVEPPWNYSSGSYTPKLVLYPLDLDCGPFPLQINVQCAPTCPTPSNASWVDKGCVVVAGAGQKRRIELSVTVTTTAAIATAQWILRKKLSSGSLGAPISGPTFSCPAGGVILPAQQIPTGPQSVELDPGDYEASLQFQYPFETCPGLTLNVTAIACPPDCPNLILATPIVTGCSPNNAVAAFNATLSWSPGQAQVPVDYYLWKLEWLDQSVSPPIHKVAENSSLGPILTPSIKTNDPGWTGDDVIAGQVNLKPRNYTVSVEAVIGGVSPTLGCHVSQSSVPPFEVPGCMCPKPLSVGTEWMVTNTTAPLGPNKFQTLTCDTAATELSVFVDQGSYALSDLAYDWVFPDGTTVIGGDSTQPFTFQNAPLGMAKTHTVTVTVRVPGSSCPSFTRNVEVTVPGCGTVVPPTAKSCSVNAGASGTGSVSVTFDQDVDKTSAEDVNNYKVSINAGPAFIPAPGSISYAAATKTATISGLTITPGDSVAVTITGVKGTTGGVMTTPGQTTCAAPGCPSGQHWDAAQGKCVPDTDGNGDGNNNFGCGILRLLLVLLFAGLIVALVGIPCGGWSIYLAIGIAIVILIALVLWIIFCKPTFCEVLLTIWQTLFTATIGLLYFAVCLSAVCALLPGAWIVGGILTIGFFVWWLLACKPSRCDVLNQLLFAVVDTAGLLGALTFGLACLNPMVLGGLAVATTVLLFALGFFGCKVRP